MHEANLRSRFDVQMIPDFPGKLSLETVDSCSAFGAPLNRARFSRPISANILEHSRNQGPKLKGEAQWDPLEKVCRISRPIANPDLFVIYCHQYANQIE
jgi:hypothetical protein